MHNKVRSRICLCRTRTWSTTVVPYKACMDPTRPSTSVVFLVRQTLVVRRRNVQPSLKINWCMRCSLKGFGFIYGFLQPYVRTSASLWRCVSIYHSSWCHGGIGFPEPISVIANYPKKQTWSVKILFFELVYMILGFYWVIGSIIYLPLRYRQPSPFHWLSLLSWLPRSRSVNVALDYWIVF